MPPFRTILIFALAFSLLTLTGCYSQILEGEVVSVGSRYKGSSQGGQEKISLIVDATQSNSRLNNVALGPSGVAIECLSTRCATIGPKTCHRFMCRVDTRLFEPNIVACKHGKEISCKEP